jgi:hypothetical protein
MDLRTKALETKKYLVDPYQDWLEREGVSVVSGRAINLFELALAPWARFGVNGAACHVEGRCDYLTTFVFELKPGQSSASVRTVHETCNYVLSGSGKSVFTLSDGRTIDVEWSAGEAFSAPVNASCVHVANGDAPARLVSFSDLRYLIGLYRNEAFLFDNAAPMTKRQKEAVDAGLSAHPAKMELVQNRGSLALAAGSIGCDITELAPHSADLASRQMQGAHFLCLSGRGFSLSFDSEASPMTRVDWAPGVLIGLPSMCFHQHFNVGDSPARFMKVELGSLQSPIFRSRRSAYGDETVYSSGSAAISRENERSDIAALRS